MLETIEEQGYRAVHYARALEQQVRKQNRIGCAPFRRISTNSWREPTHSIGKCIEKPHTLPVMRIGIDPPRNAATAHEFIVPLGQEHGLAESGRRHHSREARSGTAQDLRQQGVSAHFGTRLQRAQGSRGRAAVGQRAPG
jgi:hypothetical protein